MTRYRALGQLTLVAIALLAFSAESFGDEKVVGNFQKVSFKSDDGLEVTADLYMPHKITAPFIVLFHQARWSRGEYREIAPKLVEQGFNCMAVDLRSGDEVNDVDNETFKRAAAKKLAVDYLDALPDMVASVRFAKENYAKGKLIVWGSSYSAALAIVVAGEYPGLINGVVAFSPAEYFERAGKGDKYITNAAKKVDCPIFVTSTKNEKDKWQAIYGAVLSADRASFLPETEGNHGSRALWSRFEDSGAYWQAVDNFLTTHYLPHVR